MATDGLFDVSGKVAAITGAGGVLCSTIAEGLAANGCKVAVLDIRPDAAQAVVDRITKAGGEAMAVKVNVLDRPSVEAAEHTVRERLGEIDILINGAGGNRGEATTSPDVEFFDLPPDAVRWVFELNCVGTILPSQVFGRSMARRNAGCIINISSMCAFTPLTRVVAYSAAKAAVSNFTQWLAVYMAQNCSPNIRVNAIAPGFFLTEQNRYLLTDKQTGELTDRGQTILTHTPMGRFGEPADLLGTLLWLLGDGASFVTGIVVPVDGGFSAFSGV